MFYSRPYFEQRLKEEKFRSYRTGSHFSVILFNPFQLVSDGYKSRKKAISSLIKLLHQETRETDVKGWWDRSRVAILLPDTPAENAVLFVEKLISRIQENGYGSAELIREASFEIFTFPNTKRLNDRGEDNRREGDPEGPRDDPHQSSDKGNGKTNFPDPNSSASNGPRKYQELLKRALDILLSVIGLIILSPLFLLCALLIKLDSPGPVFFKQTRVGRGGKCFTFLKFRSMYHNGDEELHKNHIKNLLNGTAGLSCEGSSGESSYKLPEDGRVTRLGRLLRLTSIDEFPQLINVLKGEMALIGPRPHPVYEVEDYNLWQSHRLDTKPGITGLGQIYGRFNTEYEDVYRLDLRYLKRHSLVLDLKILLKTIPVVFSRRGAR